jgi:ribonuclease R
MKTEKQIETAVMELVHSTGYRPLKPSAIAKKLQIEDDERGLKKVLKRLIKGGVLAWGPQHLVMKVDRRSRGDEVVGIFRRASAGYGFVTPIESTATDRSDDIYVPIQKTYDAADGDTVRIHISRRRQGVEIRTSGRVVEVVSRRTRRFVGTYREQTGLGYVVVDGGVFDSAIQVGDAGAKNCRIGDVVVIEIAQFPSPQKNGEGVVVEVLGDRGKPGVDTLSVIREFELPGDFSETVLQEARRQADAFDESLDGRTDFTQKTVVTIDPKTARDFDDAISLEQTERGHWFLGVHIADVSHFVLRKSELDAEAYQRGTSVYLPDRVIPMLPELISNNLASLQPHRIRYCLSAIVEFDSQGVPISTELFRGAIKSAHRFTYEEIDDYLANDRPWKKKLSPAVFSLVRQMHSLAMILRKRRLNRGAIELTLPEIEIELDEDGRVNGAHVQENTESHQIIEEFMLAANEAVARTLADQGLNFLRRIHEPPSPAKLKELTRFMRQIGIPCESLESRFEIKRIAEESSDLPEAKAIHFSILRSMQKAVYSPREVGHYALNSDAYCHFTSPIRRYPDLLIHRMVCDLIDDKKSDSNFDRLVALGNHCSRLEQRAESAERELIKLKLLNYLSTRIGEEMSAVITGVEPFGLFVQGIKLPAEGLVPIANLPDDHYHFDRAGRTLSGYHSRHQFRLGDLVEVRIAHVDVNRRELEFLLIDKGGGRRNSRREKTSSPDRQTRRTANIRSAASKARRPEPNESIDGDRATGSKSTPGKTHGRQSSIDKNRTSAAQGRSNTLPGGRSKKSKTNPGTPKSNTRKPKRKRR